MSQGSDPFEVKGGIDAYSDEFAEDLLSKLDKQTKDIRGVSESETAHEEEKVATSFVPPLPPVNPKPAKLAVNQLSSK